MLWQCNVASFKTLYPWDFGLCFSAFSNGNGGFETGSSVPGCPKNWIRNVLSLLKRTVRMHESLPSVGEEPAA